MSNVCCQLHANTTADADADAVVNADVNVDANARCQRTKHSPCNDADVAPFLDNSDADNSQSPSPSTNQSWNSNCCRSLSGRGSRAAATGQCVCD